MRRCLLKPQYIAAVIVVFLAGLMAGYLPEHRKVRQINSELRAADAELTDVRGRLRFALMKRPLREAVWKVEARDYIGAEAALREFYTEVRTCLARPDMRKFRTSLENLMDKQDDVFREIHSKDAHALDLLKSMQSETDIYIQSQNSPALPAVLPAPQTKAPNE